MRSLAESKARFKKVATGPHKFQARQYRAVGSRLRATQQVTGRGYEKETSMGKERRGEGKNKGGGRGEEEAEGGGAGEKREAGSIGRGMEERLSILLWRGGHTVPYV